MRTLGGIKNFGVNKMKQFLLFLFFLNSILLAQNILVSKDSLKYLRSLHNNIDSICIYNNGDEILWIDSMENFNYTYNYLLKFSYKDSIERSGYVGYYSDIFPTPDLFPIEIPSNDSGKFVFQYIPPVTKRQIFDEIREDSIFIYNNSQNQPILIINILNDIPLNIEDRINESLKYSLLQNYPNPFNPATKIIYTLSKDDYVTIAIFDVLGRRVKLLVNDFIKKGEHEIIFNGSNLPSGVYYYQLRVRNFINTKKMLLLK